MFDIDDATVIGGLGKPLYPRGVVGQREVNVVSNRR
jgi:hypothetical protein